jgi:uncharacterized protein
MILKPKQSIAATENENYLFPVFLKLHQLKVLIVGGGYVGMEKLSAILQNSPNTNIKIVAITISDDIKAIAKKYPAITLLEKPYNASDIDDVDIVFAAVNDALISQIVSTDAKQKGKLINAADKPNLCDFYLGSIVQKGNLKIAISTNGKSPTIAKRIKEFLQLALPDNVNDLLDNMQGIRNKIAGNFSEKVKQLNEITKMLLNDK